MSKAIILDVTSTGSVQAFVFNHIYLYANA